MAEFGQVAVITKATVEEGCTTYAQGGVCAVLDPLDSVDKHISDTMVAGAHLNNPGYVLILMIELQSRLLVSSFESDFVT